MTPKNETNEKAKCTCGPNDGCGSGRPTLLECPQHGPAFAAAVQQSRTTPRGERSEPPKGAGAGSWSWEHELGAASSEHKYRVNTGDGIKFINESDKNKMMDAVMKNSSAASSEPRKEERGGPQEQWTLYPVVGGSWIKQGDMVETHRMNEKELIKKYGDEIRRISIAGWCFQSQQASLEQALSQFSSEVRKPLVEALRTLAEGLQCAEYVMTHPESDQQFALYAVRESIGTADNALARAKEGK